MIGPVEVLSTLRRKITEAGAVFVQVVNCRENPYDIIVADHLLHFTEHSLAFAGRRAGFKTIAASDRVIRKELSWIGAATRLDPLERDQPPADAANAAGLAASHVDWLGRQLYQFQTAPLGWSNRESRHLDFRHLAVLADCS